jgi:selenide,water dikinase
MKRVVLVGGGHAHLHVLRDAALRPSPGAELTLISPFDHHHYSGMVPGYLQGRYREEELAFDLRRLCQAARVRFVRGSAERIDVASRSVVVDGHPIRFDAASLDVGSAALGMDVPGAREHAWTVRPMNQAVALRERTDALIRAATGDRPVRVCVVGAGAAGVEVALALHRRIESAARRAELTLLDRGELLPGYPSRVRGLASEILSRRGITVHRGEVRAVQEDGVRLHAGESMPAELVVWLTGAAPPALIRASDLPMGSDGFFQVDSTLRSTDGAPVWGAGDCVSIEGHPDVPKAGVYAVREAPVLAHNLRAWVAGGGPREYRPQSSFLSLLNTADGMALLRWHRFVSHSRLAWWLKDRIDRRFVRRYQALE